MHPGKWNEMKRLPAVLLALLGFNANAQDCVPSSDIGRTIRENAINENTHYCASLKSGDRKHLGGDPGTQFGAIVSVDSGKQVATWSTWPQKGHNVAAIKTLPCSQFFSESEKLALTAGDPKIAEGKLKLSGMIDNQCRDTGRDRR